MGETLKYESLQSRIYSRLDEDPDGRAISFYDVETGKYNLYSYEQFYTRAAEYAGGLSNFGLGKGDVCMIVLPSGEMSAMALFAALLLGAVPLLMAPPTLQKEQSLSSLTEILVRMIRKTKPKIVILPESLKTKEEILFKSRGRSHLFFGEKSIPFVPSASIPRILPNETDIAAMQLTSGTTGFPRVCVWIQKNVLAALDGMAVAMQLSKTDICLNWTPLYHDMGLVNNFLLCITNGVPLAMLDPQEFVKKPALWLRSLSMLGATITWSPNFGFAITAQRVRDAELDDVRLNHVRSFWNAAERIHWETIQAFHQRFESFGVRFEALKTNFGCAENVGGATFSDVDGSIVVEHIDRAAYFQNRIALPVSVPNDDSGTISVVGVGRPVPGMNVKILSRNKTPLPDGHVGEIALDTPSRMVGYLKDSKATFQAIVNGNLLRTGDLGYTRDGELFWVGRARERINVRGKKLDPSDFEPVLLNVPELRQGSFAAFGVDDKVQGTERIVLVVEVRVLKPQDPDNIIAEIRNQVFFRLGINISEVLLVPSGTLTKTSSGKRRHRYFKQLYLEGALQQFVWNGESSR